MRVLSNAVFKKIRCLWVALFHAHPDTVGETYFEHLVAAGRFSLLLFAGAIAALIHALLPALCTSTARTIVESVHADLGHRSDHGSEGL